MKRQVGHFLSIYKETSYRERTMITSTASLAMGLVIGVGKLIIGIVFTTPWFIITAIYYLMLCLAKGRVLQKYYNTRDIEDPLRRFDVQFTVHKRDGVFICLIGISYLFVCLRMYFTGDSNSYPFYLIYGVAAVAFYKIGAAIHGMTVTRKMKNPLLSTLKIISLVDACVSIVAVQCALLAMQGAEGVATTSSALLGMALSLVFVSIGIFMLCRRKVYLSSDELDISDIVRKERPPRQARIWPFSTSRSEGSYFVRSRNAMRRKSRARRRWM